MIVLESVSFAYPEHDPVFVNLNWEVARGEAWAVLGPSGCGKTTLLYLLAGLRHPTSGVIRIDDQEQTGPRPRTGLILQDYGLLPWATAYKNVTLGLQIRRFYGPDGKHVMLPVHHPRYECLCSTIFLRLSLIQQEYKYPAQLSGGQRQRVAIARTLALNPDLLLMDEPFSSLDAPTRESLQNLTFELRAEEDLTTIIVTHAIEEAAILGEKIMILNQPPNYQPVFIKNPDAGQVDYRHRPAYYEMCTKLRQHLEVNQ
ncbi:MAG TPA: ABC transporter ATP-binding protein [Chloroflexi bacterium]|nr:ABC transporter ATP-binding protein [Chloroflexota bacterium]